jgi:NAD(P)-dependent dehydrogenase (short-subunit alcohol dehydrogenase family)
MKPLANKVALVAGATRGAGRAIACMLGEQGATVYCSGRTTRAQRSPINRAENIDDTADLVTQYGGKGIAVQCDHMQPTQVQALIDRIEQEQGKLDILVNDVWGGEHLVTFGEPFWEIKLENGFQMLHTAVDTHIITSHCAIPLMIKNADKPCLIVEVTDGDTQAYRGSLFYDLSKISVIRLALAQAEELKPHHIAAVAITPGFLRSEQMLDFFGVSEANWRDAVAKEPHFIASETPFFVGRAVAHLAMDANIMQKTGGAYSSWGLSEEYGFTDINGDKPHWGRYFKENVEGKE